MLKYLSGRGRGRGEGGGGGGWAVVSICRNGTFLLIVKIIFLIIF